MRSAGSRLEIPAAAIQPLVDAVHAKSWRAAARILYVNAAILAPSDTATGLVMARTVGDVVLPAEVRELLGSKIDTTLFRVGAPFIARALGTAIERHGPIIDSKAELTDEQRGEFAHLGAEIASAAFEKVLWPQIVAHAAEVTDLLSGSLLNLISGLLEQQVRAVGTAHADMISQMVTLGLSKPFLRVAVCPACMDFETTVSGHPTSAPTCGRCGRPRFVAELLLIRSDFEALKRRNEDLPAFIVSYLQHALFGAWELSASAKYTMPDSVIELDVAIPELEIGIECKVSADAFLATSAKIDSLTGELCKQARRYTEVGCKRFLAVTNLQSDAAAEIQKRLIKKLKQSGAVLDEVRVVAGDIEALLAVLDELRRELNRRWEANTQTAAKEKRKALRAGRPRKKVASPQ